MPYATNPDDGVRIYYEDVGNGLPLLLNHGFSQSSDYWVRFGYADALQKSYRLLIVDARGHGQSDRPHQTAAYAMAVMVNDNLAVLDHAGVNHTLFYGYSMGGRTGYALGLNAPERITALAIGGAYPSNRRPAVLHDWVAALRDGMDAYIGYLEDLYGTALPAERREELEASDPLALAACLEANLADPSLEDGITVLTMPVLILAGENDASVYQQAKETAARLSDGSLAILPGLGHIEAMARSDLAIPHLRRFFQAALNGGANAG